MAKTRETDNRPLRMMIVWDVLESAKDAGDVMAINACRRLINAENRGWRKHHDPADFALVMALAA